jgi:hypothetical protein
LFGSDNPVFLVDQYSGKRPFLLNTEFLQEGTFQFRLFASALLDSNLASQLHAVAYGGKVNDGFLEFLKFLTRRNKWDFSLHFYYLEHFCKSKKADFRANAISRTRALLKIQSMDKQHFLKTGKIVEDPAALQYYLHAHSAASLDEVAEIRVHNFSTAVSRADVTEHIEAIEIALAKMVLIRRFELVNKTAREQLEAFVAFLHQDLDAMLARETHLALHYFFDKAGKLLGIQPNTPWHRALKVLKSTAWDMYFIRLPEFFFTASPTEFCLSFIATQEKQLYELARLFSVERIVGFPGREAMSVVGYSLSDLPAAKQINIPSRVPNLRHRRAPAGLRDALFAELHRLLPP